MFQPAAFAAGSRVVKIVGGVASRLIVTDRVAVPPRLVAVQVNVTPDVSEVTLVVPQPVEELTADSASITDQLTPTLLVYQPPFPSVPVTVGVIVGGVPSSSFRITPVAVLGWPILNPEPGPRGGSTVTITVSSGSNNVSAIGATVNVAVALLAANRIKVPVESIDPLTK